MTLSTPVAVALKANPEMLGLMVAMPVIVMDKEIVIKCGVVWDNPLMRTPCPSFHSPEELISLGCPMVDALFDEELEEEEEETPEAETPEEAPEGEAESLN